MGVRRLGRTQRFLAHSIEILREVATDRRGAHRGAIPKRALTVEQPLRLSAPRHPAGNTREQVKRALTIATPWFPGPPPSERGCECIGVDGLVPTKNLHDRQRHRGVVRPAPGSSRRHQPFRCSARDLLRRTEHRFAEGVADSEPQERPARTR